MTLRRRDFLKSVAATPGLALGARQAPAVSKGARDVIVIGAGAFGGWTAYYLATLGARVTVVDAYGPGNSRSTSGDETRGIRSSYGDRGPWAELWMRWAGEAIARWNRFEAEWGRTMKARLFFATGDLIFRTASDAFIQRTQELWTQLRVPHELLKASDVAREFPAFDLKDIGVALHEPRAGVVRARRACEVVAEASRDAGAAIVMGYAAPGARRGSRLLNITTSGPRATLSASTFVFALGPWFPKMFPELMTTRIRTPLGFVHYFGTPPGDDRFTLPNLPSFNFPGVTGWPALAADNRGFRVRLRGDTPTDPDTSQRAFDRAQDAGARAFLAQRFPRLADAPLLETRACHYEISASRNFIIDRHPDLENVWLAGGGSAEGFKFGPVIGEYVARRVLGMDDSPALAEGFGLAASAVQR